MNHANRKFIAAATQMGPISADDEVITALIDLDRCAEIRRNIFDFAQHRQAGDYGALVE